MDKLTRKLSGRGTAQVKNARPVCPNDQCENHQAPPRGFYRKKGYRRPKHNHQPIPRYQCKACDRYFCATQTKAIRGQHRPDLNQKIFQLAVSGVSMRRMKMLLGCSSLTVSRKITHLAKQARARHAEHMKTMRTTCVMVDELHTFLHSRHKPLGVAMVVRVKTGEVLGFGVARMGAKERGRIKYKWTVDNRAQVFHKMLLAMEPAMVPGCVVISDLESNYPKWLGQGLANYQHKQARSPKTPGYDPLFAINHAFAKLRNDLARLGRKTWTTTKTIKGLEEHLWLWVAWTNGYSLR